LFHAFVLGENKKEEAKTLIYTKRFKFHLNGVALLLCSWQESSCSSEVVSTFFADCIEEGEGIVRPSEVERTQGHKSQSARTILDIERYVNLVI